MFLIQHVHRIVDGDDANQPPGRVHHRARDQVILVEDIGHVGLRIGRLDGAETGLDDIAQRHLAARGQDAPQRGIAHRLHARVDEDHVVELVRQRVCHAQKVDCLPHRPVFGGNHRFALHQTPGGVFGIGHRLFDGHPVGFGQRGQDHALLRCVEVFQNVDDIVGFQIAHRLGQDVARQAFDHLFPDRVRDFREDLAVDLMRPKPDQRAPVRPADLFEKVGDIGGMQGVKKGVDGGRVPGRDRLQHRLDPILIKDILVGVRQMIRHAAPQNLAPMPGTLPKALSLQQGERQIYPARQSP